MARIIMQWKVTQHQGLHTVHIMNNERVAEVSEHVGEYSAYFCLDKSDPELAAVIIDPYGILQRGTRHYHHLWLPERCRLN